MTPPPMRPPKASLQIASLEKRLCGAAKGSVAELAHLRTERRIVAGCKSMLGLKNPNCNVTSANVALLSLLASVFPANLRRHEAVCDGEPIGIVEVVDERWDTSSVTATIDAEAVRKDSRAALKKLVGKTSFTAFHQVRPLIAQLHPDGGVIVESRVLALIAGQALLARAKEEAVSLSQRMTSRTRRGDAISVREFGTRKRDLIAAIIEMLDPTESTPTNPVDPMLDLRMSQMRAMLMLKQTCFGIGKAQAAAAAALKLVEQEAKRLSRRSKAGVHRDGVPQFIAELNIAIGRPEWQSPFVKNRK